MYDRAQTRGRAHTHTYRHIPFLLPLPIIHHRILHHRRRQPVVRHAPFDRRGQPPDEGRGQDGGGKLVSTRDLEAPLGERARLVQGHHLRARVWFLYFVFEVRWW